MGWFRPNIFCTIEYTQESDILEIERKVEWLFPERIEKLYTGQKNMFGINRMLIIGIGNNGTDCVLRCKHLTERRFGSDLRKMRYLCVGEEKALGSASCHGTVLTAEERLPIIPEEAIYNYLNDPKTLPQYARSWFDSGLKNYSPAAPTYGLAKRQCGRLALFHNIAPLRRALEESLAAFSGSDKSLEIVFVGNIGDAFFGGMFIDLAYICKEIFGKAEYPIKVSCLMFAPDTAELDGTEQRALGNYFVNAIVTKNELDRFQTHRKPFTQKYSDSFEVTSGKPPFNTVFIAPAEKDYEYTMRKAAEKILSRMEVLFKKDDDAERIMSYNMLKPGETHEFRYLTFGAEVCEAPMNRIMSYLALKVFMLLYDRLKKNSAGESKLGQYVLKVMPSDMMLASKNGEIPKPEFNGKKNPVFAPKNLKMGLDGPINYVKQYVEKFSQAVSEGGKVFLPEICYAIISSCEAAKTDISKGPFYSIEIIQKCLTELQNAIAKAKALSSDMSERMKRSRDLVNAAYTKFKSSALFSGKAAEQFIRELADYTECGRKLKSSKIMAEFYKSVYDKLKEYLDTLSAAADAFGGIAANCDLIMAKIKEPDEFAAAAFPVEELFSRLETMIVQIPEHLLSAALKESGILTLPADDETATVRAVVFIASKCFDNVFSMSFSELCAFAGKGGVGYALEQLCEKVGTSLPTSDDFALNRIICPKATRQDDIADLRSDRRGMNYIWNGSVLRHTAVVTQIKGAVRLEDFPDYEKWENMRCAYVNDPLKKYGIHIFG